MDVIVLLPDDFGDEKAALAVLVQADMLAPVEIRFEYPGEDDAPDRNT